MNEPAASTTSPAFWAGVGVIATAAFGAVVKMVRGSRADDRADFTKITNRLDRELTEARAEIRALWAQIAQMKLDHASCESEKNRLTSENRQHQAEIDELRARLAKLEK